VAQAIPAFFESLSIGLWSSLSIMLIFASYGLYRYIIRGHSGTAIRVVMVALILFDLTTFNWVAASKLEAERTGSDSFERVLSTRGAVDFLRSRPGRFRVYIPGDSPPPIGDLFRVATLNGGMRATLLENYLHYLWGGRLDLLNVHYLLKPASSAEPGDLYHDSKWKVYENPTTYSAAWVVHQVVIEPSRDELKRRLGVPGIDFHTQALLGERLESALDPAVQGAAEDVRFGACGPNRTELTARSQSRGLLVLSEIFYPGWHATVNGRTVPIHEVDGALRGVVIPGGQSRVVLRYFPWTFWLGSLLSLAAFSGVLLAVLVTWRRNGRKHFEAQAVPPAVAGQTACPTEGQ